MTPSSAGACSGNSRHTDSRPGCVSPCYDNRADDGVKQNRQENEGPLGHFQGSLTHAVDQIDALLVAVVEDPHVGQEMDDQEPADRDQAGQRMQAADEEFMPPENRSNVCHFPS